MMQFPTLYKLDSKNKVREWSVSVDNEDVVVLTGLQGGALVESRYTAKPKNKGRANATTAAEQAVAEAKALWVKQRDRKLYAEEVVSKEDKEPRPMLARDYKKVSQQVKWGKRRYKHQPKLNGVRAFIYRDGRVMSRKGKEYVAMRPLGEHIAKFFFVHLPEKTKILDGELYCHGTSLQKINSAVKKTNEDTPRIQFWMYDVVDDGTFEERFKEAFFYGLINRDKMRVVFSDTVNNEAELKAFHDANVLNGYEGAMLRDADGLYECDTRSAFLFKYKDYQDDEFLIVGVETDKVGQGKFACHTKEGKVFEARPVGENSYRLYIAANPQEFIGKYLNVKFFGYSDDGIPEQPVGMYIREVDENGEPEE